jgi:hypothetical protein
MVLPFRSAKVRAWLSARTTNIPKFEYIALMMRRSAFGRPIPWSAS